MEHTNFSSDSLSIVFLVRVYCIFVPKTLKIWAYQEKWCDPRKLPRAVDPDEHQASLRLSPVLIFPLSFSPSNPNSSLQYK